MNCMFCPTQWTRGMLARIRCRKMKAMIYIMLRYRRFKKRFFLSQIIDRFRYEVSELFHGLLQSCIVAIVQWSETNG